MPMQFDSWDAGLHTRDSNNLSHFGIKGMRWGQRRYQNEDGSLTPLGEKRYGSEGKRGSFGRSLDLNKMDRERTMAKSKSDFYRGLADDRYNRQKYKAEKKGLPKPEMDEETKKYRVKSAQYAKLAGNSEKMVDRILKNTLGKKMDVRSSDMVRQGYNGFVAGKGYKVKKKGTGKHIHRKRDTKRMINNAYRAQQLMSLAYGYAYGSGR